jgi:DNA-binding LytR/AlgR family response regulator
LDSPVKLLIVEDDMIIAAKISLQLTKLGYEVTAIVPRGEEAILQAQENKPDIVLLDINLKGALDGVETAYELNRLVDVPIIYVTANTDEATFNRAKATRPYAFITKPIKNVDLQRAIELTISRMADNQPQVNEPEPALSEATPFVLSDRIFVRNKEKMVKIFFEDILYIEANRNYCNLYTPTKEHILATSLRVMEDKLPAQQFLRVHRSFMVNLTQIDEVAENHVLVAEKAIPLSPVFREELLKRIQTI